MSDPKQGDSEQNQTNPSDDIQGQGQQDQQEQGQQQGAAGDSAAERERVAAPESEDLYTVVIPKGKRTASAILERESPTPEQTVGEEDIPPPLPPRAFLEEEYDDVEVSHDILNTSDGIYQPLMFQSGSIYRGIDSSQQVEQQQEAQYDAAVLNVEPRRFLYEPYVYSNGQEALDFEFDTPWADVRNSVLSNQVIEEELLTTSGPVRDIADRIVNSKGKLSEGEIEEILDVISVNEAEIARDICNPLRADIDNNPVTNPQNVMTLMHLVYACDVDIRILKALGEVQNSAGDLGAYAYDVLDSEGNLPLHHAAKNCTGEKLRVCMERTNQQFLDTPNFDNQSPLHIITQKSSCSTLDIQEFINRDLDFGLVDGDGKNPLHHAVEHLPNILVKRVMDHIKDSTEFKDKNLVNSTDYMGNTIVHCAVKNPEAGLTLFNILKTSGADLDVRNAAGRSPIHLAASSNKPNAIVGLVSCNVNVNSQDIGGDTPLHVAVEGGNLEAVLAVLNQRDADVSVQNHSGATPVLSAAKYADLAILRALGSAKPNIKQGNTVARALVMGDHKGFTPLHFIAGGGSRATFRVMRRMFEKHYDLGTVRSALTQDRSSGEVVNLVDFANESILNAPSAAFLLRVQSGNFGLSPACCAVAASNHKVLDDISNFVGEQVHISSDRGYNTMQIAALFGDKATVKILAKNAKPDDLNFSTSATLSPLHLACLRGDNDVIRGLVGQSGIDINQRMGVDCNTVLHYAISKGDSSLVQKILTHPGVNVNLENEKGQTPLHLAVDEGNPQIISSLLKFNASVNRLDGDGKSILSSAIVPGKKEKEVLTLVNKLLNKGADITLDGDCNILLDKCVKCGYNKVLDKLIEKGAEVNQDSDIRPMVSAAISGNSYAIKSLANAGGDVNEVVNNPSSRHSGNPLVMVALADGNMDLIKSLVAEGCDVGKQGRNGDTALHDAANHSDPGFGNRAIRVLTSRNSVKTNRDILTVKNNTGDTPLHKALKSGNVAAVQNMLKAVHGRYARDVLTARDKAGYAPVHFAVGVSNSDVGRSVLEAILSKGENNLMDIVGLQDPNFRTVLHTSIIISDYSSMNMIIDKLPRTVLSNLSKLTDIHGDTPLHLSCQSGNAGMTQYFLRNLDKRELPDILKIKNKDGSSPLHDAVRNADVKSAKIMIRNCNKKALADVLKCRDGLGNTVLHAVAEQVIANPELKKDLDGLMNLAMKKLNKQELSEIINTRNDFDDTVAHSALISDMKCAKNILKLCNSESFLKKNGSDQSLSDCIRNDSRYKKGGIFGSSLFKKLKKMEQQLAQAEYAELSSISSGSDISSVSTDSTELGTVEMAGSASVTSFKHAQESGLDTSSSSDSESLGEGLSDTSIDDKDFEQQMAALDQEIADIVSGLPEVTQAAVGQQAASPSAGQAAGMQQKDMQR